MGTMVMDTITRRVTRKIVIVIVIAIAKNVKTKVKNPIKKDHQTTKVMMTKTKKDMETEVLALLPVLKTKIVCRNPPNLNGNHQKWTKLRLKSDKLNSFDMFAPKAPKPKLVMPKPMESPKPTPSTPIINNSLPKSSSDTTVKPKTPKLTVLQRYDQLKKEQKEKI